MKRNQLTSPPGVRGAIRALLLNLGFDPEHEAIKETPDRVQRAYEELLSGYEQNPASILKKRFKAEGQPQIIAAANIPFTSLCEHHLLPFAGVVHIAYIPRSAEPLPGTDAHCMVVGASKLARLVECFARRLQLQEQMGNQIADSMVARLSPQGVMVIISAEHQCMTCRGVKSTGAKFITSSLRGVFDKNPTARAEAMQLLQLQT